MRAEPRKTKSDLVRMVLQRSGTPLGAYAIADHLTRATGRKNHANSIYRVIVPLEDAGEVLRVVTLKGWIATDPGAGPMIVLMCDGCKTTRTIPGLRTFVMVQDACMAAGFAPARVAIEVVGHCLTCDTAASSAQ